MVSEEKREEARRIVEEEPGAGGCAGEAGGRGDVEELREVLRSVSEFIRELREPLEKLLDTLLSAMDGSKVGGDVAAFYRKLREEGVPEDLAGEMTREYFRARIQAFNIVDLISKAVKRELEEE